MEFAKEVESEQKQDKVIRFGNGGLVKKLHEFLVVYKMESKGGL
ncbi:hypothetical protein ACIQZI_16960 [Peribacillus sp. NPDC096379]